MTASEAQLLYGSPGASFGILENETKYAKTAEKRTPLACGNANAALFRSTSSVKCQEKMCISTGCFANDGISLQNIHQTCQHQEAKTLEATTLKVPNLEISRIFLGWQTQNVFLRLHGEREVIF